MRINNNTQIKTFSNNNYLNKKNDLKKTNKFNSKHDMFDYLNKAYLISFGINCENLEILAKIEKNIKHNIQRIFHNRVAGWIYTNK